ncbi:MAG: two-component regulator propeller domain-containing protein, partial [Candidatus Cryptobacteroides sp.]
MLTFLLVCALLTAAVPPVHAAGEGHIRFSNLSIDDGLSQNTVFSLCQDSEGYIWMATLEGLNRFDGNSFTVFVHDEDNPGSLPDNIMHTLSLDSQGVLWIGTESSLVRWNRRMERFDSFPAGSSVMSIAEVSPQMILVGTEKGLRVFDPTKDSFIDGLPENTARLKVKSMARLSDNIYMGSMDEGLFRYSVKDGELRKIPVYGGNRAVQSIFVQNGNLLWFGTEGDGLYCLNLDSGDLRNFRVGDPGGIGSNFVRSIASDTEGRLWIGTFNCLDIYDSVTDSFECYMSDPFREGAISQNSVRCILRDNQGGMWLGTYFGGVDYWHPLRNRFENIRRTPGDNSLNDDIVNCITPAPDGVLWIGTNNGGVNSYDPLTGRFSNFGKHPANRSNGLESNDIKAIHIDPATSDIYIGAHAGGLCVLPAHSRVIRQCAFSGESSTTPVDIYSIIEDTPGVLWVGSLQGLFSYGTSTGRLRSHPTGDGNGEMLKIRALMKDSAGRLWVGGENGMEILERKDGEMVPVDPGCDELLGLSFILGFHESSSGIVWTATRNGLFAYSTKEGTLKRYTVSSGLPSNVINGIEEDSFGRLWLSTDNGLSCMNPYSGVFRNFTVKDGIPSRQFNMGSHCRLNSGRMYFGGIRGITTFIPERITDNPYSPSPVLSGFRVFNDRVVPGDGSGILTESIASTGRVSLRHNCNSFSVDFTVNDFIAG